MRRLFLGIVLWLFLLGCSAPLIFRRSTSAIQASPKLEPRLVEVRADVEWNDTGIVVRAGDLLVIRYVSGLWSPWKGSTYDAIGSGGDPNCGCNVLKGVSHAALIGKIGETNPFFVGANFHHRMGEAGILYLGINDTRTTDNSGSLFVEVEVWR